MAGNYPAPREIPRGKVLLADPLRDQAEIAANRARLHLIAEAAPGALLKHSIYDGKVRLVWSSPGWEIAGSMMRWTNGFWAVWWLDRSYARQGRRYLPDDAGETTARAHFARLTATPSTEQSQ